MIQLHKDGAIWRLTLNRPDKANSLTQDMLEEILQIVQMAQTAQALILTGAGKTFTSLIPSRLVAPLLQLTVFIGETLGRVFAHRQNAV